LDAFEGVAAEAVAGVHPPLLQRLAGAALVRRTEAGRFVMHELVRRYALGRLEPRARGELEARYVAYHVGLLGRLRVELRGEGHAAARRRLVAEVPNLRHAVEVGLRSGPAALADAMGPLVAVLSILGHADEGLGLFARLADAFAARGDAALAARARACQSRMLFAGGRIAEGWELLRPALPELEASGDELLQAALCWAAMTMRLLGDLEAAERHGERALALAEAAGARGETADALAVLALVHEEAGDARAALAAAERCAALRRAEGDAVAAVQADVRVVQIMTRDLGDLAGAEAVIGPALATARRVGDDRLLGEAVVTAAVVAGQKGDVPAAVALSREALAIAERLWNVHHAVIGRSNLAGYLSRLGELDEARELLLGALALSRQVGARGAAKQALCLLGENARLRRDHLEAVGAYAQAFEAALAIRPVNRSIAQGVSLVAKLHADVGDHERAYALSEYLLAEPLAQAPIRALNGQVVEERRSRLPPARARAVAAEAATWDLGRVVTDEVALLADLRRRLERSPRAAPQAAPRP
ncbi:MAG TPA: tetratricopeptide repeat protein, partial [Trueperaceae bacterium]|nr:tetratricopeptide repeat protein [Trueperaceae bacterium]